MPILCGYRNRIFSNDIVVTSCSDVVARTGAGPFACLLDIPVNFVMWVEQDVLLAILVALYHGGFTFGQISLVKWPLVPQQDATARLAYPFVNPTLAASEMVQRALRIDVRERPHPHDTT